MRILNSHPKHFVLFYFFNRLFLPEGRYDYTGILCFPPHDALRQAIKTPAEIVVLFFLFLNLKTNREACNANETICYICDNVLVGLVGIGRLPK